MVASFSRRKLFRLPERLTRTFDFSKWRACDRFTCCGKKLLQKPCVSSVSQHLRPHQRPWHSGIEISYCSSLHTNGHRRSRLAAARSQSFSLATQQVNINLHAAWYWFHSIHREKRFFTLRTWNELFFARNLRAGRDEVEIFYMARAIVNLISAI